MVASGVTRIADETGKIVYYFDSTGKIIETKTGITGTTIFSFTYDVDGRLLTIAQPFSKITTFTRNSSGVLQSITAPNGAVTDVTINSYGYLTSITNPNSESYTMTYHGTTGGLLATFEKPNGNVTALTYDLKGNLTSNSHTSGYTLTLSKILGEVKATSSENINYSNKYNPFDKQEMSTDPNGVTSYITRSEISNTSSSPIKYTSTRYRDDLRFGKQVKALRSKGLGDFGNRSSDFTHSVTLATPSDPFSITTMSIIEDISPSRMTSVYTGSTKTWNHTSKLGRTCR